MSGAWAQPEAPSDPPAVDRLSVDDPMLAPAPRPARTLASWHEAQDLMVATSPDLLRVEAGVRRSEALWRESLAALRPQAHFSLGATYDVVNPDTPPVLGANLYADGRSPTSPVGVATVVASQTLANVPAWRREDAAEAQQEAATATYQDVRRRITQGLATALVAVVTAERSAEINRVGLRQALERAAITDRTFELGRATRLDAVRVRQDVPIARAALVSGDESLRRTREALAQALGIPGEVGVAPDFSLEGLVAQVRESCEPLGDGVRDDLTAAKAQVSAADLLEREASAGYLPRFDLQTQANAATTDPGPAAMGSWSIMAVLSVPIWEGGLRDGLVDERRAIGDQARQDEESLRRAVAIEVARARRGERYTGALVEAATSAQKLAHEAEEMTRRSFQIGRATSLELVQSAAALRQADLTLALREFEWVRAQLDAFLAEARCP